MYFLEALILILPIALAGALHMRLVKKNSLPALNRPLSVKAFGANKTLRGFVIMVLATGFFTWLLIPLVSESPFPWDARKLAWLGFLVGLFYCLFELPNSYLKRRMGIAPGKRSEDKAFLFVLLDQADSAIGCSLAYWLWLDISLNTFGALILLGTGIHLGVNYLLYLAGLRKEPV